MSSIKPMTLKTRVEANGQMSLDAADVAREVPITAGGARLADRDHDGWITPRETHKLGAGVRAWFSSDRGDGSMRLEALATLAQLKESCSPDLRGQVLFTARYFAQSDFDAHGSLTATSVADALTSAASVLSELFPDDAVKLAELASTVRSNPSQDLQKVQWERAGVFTRLFAAEPPIRAPEWVTRYDVEQKPSLWAQWNELFTEPSER